MDYTGTLKHIGTNYRAGLEQATRAKAQAETVIPQAIAAGHSEREIARLLGVDRMTVRAWQGKR